MRRAERIHRLPDHQARQDLVDAVPLGRQQCLLQWVQRAGRRALTHVCGDAAADHDQVGGNAAAGRVELPRVPPQPHEGLLHHLLGQSRIAKRLQPISVQPAGIPPVQLSHWIAHVPGRDPGNQSRFLLGQWVIHVSHRHPADTLQNQP